jgi:hypothetical protein
MSSPRLPILAVGLLEAIETFFCGAANHKNRVMSPTTSLMNALSVVRNAEGCSRGDAPSHAHDLRAARQNQRCTDQRSFSVGPDLSSALS